MNSKRPLVPAFLNKFDRYLLLHQPETWSARTHLVVYYGLLFLAVLTGLCFIVPNDARSDTPVAYWIGFLVIVDIIAIVGWLIFLFRFNVFKRYGNITPIGRLRTFILYFISIGTIVLFAYLPPAVESIRANIAYGNDEIVNDINSINTRICQIEYDSLQHKWSEDTVLVVDKKSNATIAYEKVQEAGINNPDTLMAEVHPPYHVIDTAELAQRLTSVDSVVKVNDTMYVLNECPDYNFLKVYRSDFTYILTANNHPKQGILTSQELFNNVIRNYKRPDFIKLKQEMAILIKKYDYRFSYNNSYRYEEGSDMDPEISFSGRLERRYHLSQTRHSLENIIERKYRWNARNFGWQFRLFLYISFILTLLIFIFRHSTVKTFFLSLLTAVILTILSSITLVFSNGHENSGGFAWIIFYSVLFAALSFTVFGSTKRNLLSGISINLFVLMVTFIPLTTVCYYYSLIRREYYDDIVGRLNPIDQEVMYRNIFYAEIAGFTLLLILLPTLIHKLYRRWYSLPQE